MIILNMESKAQVRISNKEFNLENNILILELDLGLYDLTNKTITAVFNPSGVETAPLEHIESVVKVPIYSNLIKYGLNYIQLNFRWDINKLEQSPIMAWKIDKSLATTTPAQEDIDIISYLISEVNRVVGETGDIKEALDESVTNANTINGILTDAVVGTIKVATDTGIDLEDTIEDANYVKGLVEATIDNSEIAKTNLEGTIGAAGTAQTNLNTKIGEAATSKQTLDQAIVNNQIVTLPVFNAHKIDYTTLKTNVEKYDSFSTVANPPKLMRVPVISDTYNFDTNILTHNTAKRMLSGLDYNGILTSLVHADYIYTTVITGAKLGTALISGMTVYKNSSGIELVEVAGLDNVNNPGKYSYQTTGRLWIFVPKGMYADIASARIGLGTTEVIYQLETPTTESVETYGYLLDLTDYNNFEIDVETSSEKEIKFINVPAIANKIISATLKMKYTAGAILRFPDVIWQNGITPTFTVGKTYIVIFTSYNNGTSWMASVVGEW